MKKIAMAVTGLVTLAAFNRALVGGNIAAARGLAKRLDETVYRHAAKRIVRRHLRELERETNLFARWGGQQKPVDLAEVVAQAAERRRANDDLKVYATAKAEQVIKEGGNLT